VQAANAIIAMAAGMVTNCRISHFLYEAAAMVLAQLLENTGLLHGSPQKRRTTVLQVRLGRKATETAAAEAASATPTAQMLRPRAEA
jgi:hypothetical protein